MEEGNLAVPNCWYFVKTNILKTKILTKLALGGLRFQDSLHDGTQRSFQVIVSSRALIFIIWVKCDDLHSALSYTFSCSFTQTFCPLGSKC